MRYDLHCHSTHSDGLLSPSEVVARAAQRGVEVLALTDHDELSGLAEARAAAAACGVALVPGVEITTSYESAVVHVVGLHVDPQNPTLAAALADVRSGRQRRARRMADSLAEAGIRGAYEGALKYVTHEALIARPHFARFLVEAGYVSEVKDAFKRFLTPGKPGYVPHRWPTLDEGVQWIRAAGGDAVLAHPARYELGPAAMRRLIQAFTAAGGVAIEVLSSAHTATEAAEIATLARVHGLRASVGSDYHGPGESPLDFGELPELPAGLTPVWQGWEDRPR